MKLKDILEKKGAEVFSIAPDATLRQAVDELVRHNVGVLVVEDPDGKVVGILSERDILYQCQKAGGYEETVRIRDVMSKKVITADAETEIDQAMLRMFLHQIRHLPVTVRDKPEGMISVRDMFLADLLRFQEESLRFKQFMTSSFEKLEGKKILVAEEDPQALSLVETVFTACGVTILGSRDGEDCLRKIQAEKPDLVILNDLMPKLSGYEVVEKLRRGQDPIKDVPMIVVAAKPSMGSLFRDLGIEHYLPKPVSPYVLLKRAEAIFQYGAEMLRQSGPKNYAVGAGIQQFEMEKVRTFLGKFALTADLCSSEEDCLKAIRKNRPKFVFVFFWEEDEKFDALKVYREMQNDPRLKAIPFACFCHATVESNCASTDLRRVMICYEHIEDLMKGFLEFLKKKVIPC